MKERKMQYWENYMRLKDTAHSVKEKYEDKGQHILADAWYESYNELAVYWFNKYLAVK